MNQEDERRNDYDEDNERYADNCMLVLSAIAGVVVIMLFLLIMFAIVKFIEL